MAFRAAARNHWRSMLQVNGVAGGNRAIATSVHADHHHHHASSTALKADFAPVVMVLGMVLVAVGCAAHTAKQQLFHSPAVRVNKKRRESVPEVDDPDYVVGGADKFINKSFFRKVAHIQDHDSILPDHARVNPFTRSREIESLKSVGAQGSGH